MAIGDLVAKGMMLGIHYYKCGRHKSVPPDATPLGHPGAGRTVQVHSVSIARDMCAAGVAGLVV